MTVYIDEVFMVNLIMDWLVLWTTARMLSVAGKLAEIRKCSNIWSRIFYS